MYCETLKRNYLIVSDLHHIHIYSIETITYFSLHENKCTIENILILPLWYNNKSSYHRQKKSIQLAVTCKNDFISSLLNGVQQFDLSVLKTGPCSTGFSEK